MRRPLIHIGYHKSGSSWLQRYLFGKGDRGFAPMAPPDHGMANPSKFMSRFFVFDEGMKMLPPFVDRLEEVKEFVTGWKPSGEGVPVISHERLSGNPHSGGFDAKAIAGRLADAFPEARIFIVIREQRSIILSTYFQYLRVGGVMSLRKYLEQGYDGRLPGFSREYFNYDRLVACYRELFGGENVLVLPFESFCADAGAFVARIGEFAGAEIPAVEFEFEDRLNQGLPRLIEYRTRLCNYLAYSDSANGHSPVATRAGFRFVRWMRKQLTRVVPDAAESRFVDGLREEVADFAGEAYAESNRRTEALTGLDLCALGYR